MNFTENVHQKIVKDFLAFKKKNPHWKLDAIYEELSKKFFRSKKGIQRVVIRYKYKEKEGE